MKIKSTIKKFTLLYDIFLTEFRESVTDAGTVLIFGVAAILYPMIYSVGYLNETIREIPVAVIDRDHTALSRQYSRMLDATEQLKVVYKPNSMEEAEQLFFSGKINGIVFIPAFFQKDMLRGTQGKITVYCDAARFFVYKQVYTAASNVTTTMNAGVEVRSMLANGKMWNEAVNRCESISPQVFDLYNPSSGYATFIVPGILIIVIQQSLLVGIGLLFGKHRERKTLNPKKPATEAAGSFVTILGKSMAYVSLYLATSLVTLLLFYHWLSFPDKTNFFSLYPLLILFLFTVSFMGISISIWFRKRAHALMFIVFLSPMIFFLCGVAWPVESLPGYIKGIGCLFPTTPMLPAFLKLRVMGGGPASVTHETTILMIQLLGYLALAVIMDHLAKNKTQGIAPS